MFQSSMTQGNGRTRLIRAAAIGLMIAAAGTVRGGVEYTVIDLGVPEGAFQSLPNGINNEGEVVGWSGNSGSPFYKAWKWSPDEGLVTLPPISYGNGDVNYAATDLNDQGLIIGDPDGGNEASYGNAGWRFAGAGYALVPMLQGHTWATLTGVNEDGAVAGFSDDYSVGGVTEQFFFHSAATGLLTMPQTPGQIWNIGKMNNQGVVAGTMNGVAFRWSVEAGYEFLPPPPPFDKSYAWGINEAGDVSGTLTQGNEKFGAIYIQGQGWQAIANFALPGCCSDPHPERGEAVNASGEVAGFSALTGSALSGHHVAWTWSADNGVRLLSDVIDPSLNVVLRRAVDINDSGQIVAVGRDNDLPENNRAFLLTPVVPSTPQGDCNGDGVVDVSDLLAVIGAWGPCPAPPVACPADITNDGVANIEDLLILISNWSR